MMDLLVTQAHPWFMNEPEIADVLESGPGHMLVKLDHVSWATPAPVDPDSNRD